MNRMKQEKNPDVGAGLRAGPGSQGHPKKIAFTRCFLGYMAYVLSFLLYKSLRIRYKQHADYNPKQQYFSAFWHGKQWLPVLRLAQHQTKRVVLVSPSRDGDVLACWLKRLGYEIIRGSSRRDNTSALRAMRRKVQDGYSLGFGVDGPIGPMHSVKPGMTYLSQKGQVPIVPIGSAFVRPWVLEKAWDRYEIPKPFSKAAFYIGKPIYIAKDAHLEESNRLLEKAIFEAEAQAHALLDEK